MEKDKEKNKYNKYEQIVLEKIDKNNEILEKYFIKDTERIIIKN